MEFLRRNRVLLASASLLVCSLLLVSVSVRAEHRDPVGRLLLDGLAPFQVVFSWVGRGTGRLWSGYVAVVQGGSDGDCYMNYLNRDADVKVGDHVLTSGLDGVFPKGMTIGEVIEVGRRHRGLLQSATVTPSAALDRVEEVMLVAPTAPSGEPPA